MCFDTWDSKRSVWMVDFRATAQSAWPASRCRLIPPRRIMVRGLLMRSHVRMPPSPPCRPCSLRPLVPPLTPPSRPPVTREWFFVDVLSSWASCRCVKLFAVHQGCWRRVGVCLCGCVLMWVCCCQHVGVSVCSPCPQSCWWHVRVLTWVNCCKYVEVSGCVHPALKVAGDTMHKWN